MADRQSPDGATLALSGALDRGRAAQQLRALRPAATHRRIDLTAVERVDSAGVALIAELVDRVRRASGERPQVSGSPPGLAELCEAYRIQPDFSDYP